MWWFDSNKTKQNKKPSSKFFANLGLNIHTVKGFGIVNKAEIYVLLELSCFFDDPVDVGN